MGNKLIRTGVLLLFFTLMGGFVLYKMGFFKDRKEKSLEYSIGIYDDEVEEKDIIHSTKSFGGNSGIRIQDFINREDSIRDSIKRAKQFLMLSSKSGVVLDLEKDVDLIFENLKEEELTRLKQNEDSLQRILMGSSKSRMIFDSDDIKQAEFKIPKLMMSTSKSIMIMEPVLQKSKFQPFLPQDSAIKALKGSSKYIK